MLRWGMHAAPLHHNNLAQFLDTVERTHDLLEQSARLIAVSRQSLHATALTIRQSQIAVLRSRASLAGKRRVIVVRNSN